MQENIALEAEIWAHSIASAPLPKGF